MRIKWVAREADIVVVHKAHDCADGDEGLRCGHFRRLLYLLRNPSRLQHHRYDYRFLNDRRGAARIATILSFHTNPKARKPFQPKGL